VENGYYPTREKARAAIMAGHVTVDGRPVDKAGHRVSRGASVEVRGEPYPYVSRGGVKLEKALRDFGIVVEGLVAIDVGASTGGFTDCLLRAGARKVYAVDVGYGQLAWPLRADPRVIPLERRNIRYLRREELGEEVDLATIDVSFISLLKVLPTVKELLKAGGNVLGLVKPQFEAGRDKVGKGGVVKDPAVHREVLERVLGGAAGDGWGIRALSFSPLAGPRGNLEFWVHLSREGGGLEIAMINALIPGVVAAAHREVAGRSER